MSMNKELNTHGVELRNYICIENLITEPLAPVLRIVNKLSTLTNTHRRKGIRREWR